MLTTKEKCYETGGEYLSCKEDLQTKRSDLQTNDLRTNTQFVFSFTSLLGWREDL